ncbi:MAG: hypothetical protein QOI89_2446 [Solirubrobacteraceae bacterium]|jgi:kynurenine formamidase|nr:hypothetical protein [Solirubrobacteraceae bacterium]
MLDVRTEWVNLSQTVREGEQIGVHRPPRIETHRLTPDISVTSLAMDVHASTHVDAACHTVPGDRSIDSYSLGELVGPGVVLDVRSAGEGPITAERLTAGGAEIRDGDVVFACCGFAGRFGTSEYFAEHPYLSADAAELLVQRRVRMFGIDAPTPDLPGPKRDEPFELPIHARLVGAGVLIVENLGGELASLVGQRLLLGILPLAVRGSDGGPGVAFGLRLSAANGRAGPSRPNGNAQPVSGTP